MNLKKLFIGGLAVTLLTVGLAGCGANDNKTAGSDSKTVTLKVGTLSGPHSEILEEAKKVGAKNGLDIQIVTFNDYVQPNEALNQGEIDANMFQHQPFLDNHIKDRGYKLTALGKTVLFPMGVYSQKIKSVDEIKDNMEIAIPNDPSNGGRALEILDHAGIIKLRPDLGASKATVQDIQDNKYNLKIDEVDAAMIPRMLPDLDFAVINNSYAQKAGLVPTKDAFILEDENSRYANILAVRTADKDKPEMKKLLACIQSPEVADFIKDHFKGSAIPAWKE